MIAAGRFFDMDHQMVHSPWQAEIGAMKVSVTEAKAQLTELVRRAEAGEEVVLTRRGLATVRLVKVAGIPDARARRTLMEKVRAAGGARAATGAEAARSQDFLYGDDGLPA